MLNISINSDKMCFSIFIHSQVYMVYKKNLLNNTEIVNTFTNKV